MAEQPTPRECGVSAPERVGPYRVIEKLGEGGMGIVYLAEREKPQRRVALKVIRAGALGPETLRRFELECEALARLKHAGIAQIYDAGTADMGHGPQPYFAMEHVSGEPIDEFARRRGLSHRQRLELVARAGDALQHAHQKGVIHRDLKPSNILVEETAEGGQPKILDFGVARVSELERPGATLATGMGQLIGTLEYMSPEQATGDPSLVDVRTDIYSLGLVAYVVLAGELPYDVEGKSVYEAACVIRNVEPRPLRTKHSRLRGDAETVVFKALAKEREDRYASASDFAQDIRRFLADQPIAARAPSTVYQIRKLAKRHKAVVALVAAVAASLVLGVALTSWQARTATRARDEARRAEATARAVNDFLVKDLLLAADPHTTKGKSVSVSDVLAAAEKNVAERLADSPEIRAAVHAIMGEIDRHLGRLDEAERHFEAEIDLRENVLGRRDAAALEARRNLARTYVERRSHDRAETLARETVERARAILGDDHKDLVRIRMTLAQALASQGKHAEAETIFAEIRAAYDASGRPPDSLIASFLSDSADIARKRGDFALAEKGFLEALALFRSFEGDVHPDVARVLGLLGSLYANWNRSDDALARLDECLAIQRKLFGDDHADLVVTLGIASAALASKGDLAASEARSGEALLMARRLFAADDPRRVSPLKAQAAALVRQGRAADAEPLLREAIDLLERSEEGPSDSLGAALFDLAYLLKNRGDTDGALAVATRMFEIRRSVETPDVLIAQSQSFLAQLRHIRAEYDLAEPLYLEAMKGYEAAYGPKDLNVAIAHANLSAFHRDQGKLADAVAAGRRGLEIAAECLAADHPTLAGIRAILASAVEKEGGLDEAERLWREVLDVRRAKLRKGHPSTLATAGDLARVLAAAGRPGDAEPLFREAVDGLCADGSSSPSSIARAKGALGECLVALERFDEAERLLLESHSALEAADQQPSREDARTAIARLVALYVAWRRDADADAWREELAGR